jgi:hypothetical protein
MGHYAKVVDGIVVNVIVAEADFFDTFIDESAGTWVQTSYNTRGGVHYDSETHEPDGGTPLRKNYASIGYTYDRVRDAFIPPQPFPSYTLNEDTCLWEAPVPYPEDGNLYIWDEDAGNWSLIIEEE